MEKNPKTIANPTFQPMSNDTKKSSDPNDPKKKEIFCLFFFFPPFVGN